MPSDNIFDTEEFQNLSPVEREKVITILKEYSANGLSQTLADMRNAAYKEVPVDILTFVKDRRFLGNAWHDSSGRCKLFPYWEEKLQQIFPDPYTTSINNLILSGARGLGKSEVAVTCGLYIMYRVLCLQKPLDYFNLKPSETIAFAFMNITEALAYDIGVSKFQATVQLSPWFLKRGTLTGRDTVVWNPPDYINVIVGSQPRHVIGQAVLFCLEGATKVRTMEGDYRLDQLEGKTTRVFTITDRQQITLSDPCTVKVTDYSRDQYIITLADGTRIKCTASHRLLMEDGNYKQAW